MSKLPVGQLRLNPEFLNEPEFAELRIEMQNAKEEGREFIKEMGMHDLKQAEAVRARANYIKL